MIIEKRKYIRYKESSLQDKNQKEEKLIFWILCGERKKKQERKI